VKQVTLFLHSCCGRCRAAVEFLRAKGIVFEDKNIQADPQAYDELVNKWNSRAAVTLVIDSEVIIGLQRNRERLEKLLP
jgi:arsenate reductase-like glutaredoxin family protein